MTDPWVSGLNRFEAGTSGCAWRQDGDKFFFDEFGIWTTAHELDPDDLSAQVEACGLQALSAPEGLAAFEAHLHAFFTEVPTKSEREARWGAVEQAIEIIHAKLLAENRRVPPAFERARFLAMAYPADIGSLPLRQGERPRDERLHSSLLTWLELLDRYEDDAVFPNWDAARISREYDYVTQRLAVQKTLSRPAPGVFASEVARFAGHHLLPRYDLAHTLGLSHQLYRWWTRATALAVAVLLAVPGVLWLGPGGPHARLGWAARCAGLAFALLIFATVKAAPVVAYPYCLRLPAGAAVGMLAVLSTDRITLVTPTWWQVLVPVGALFGYVAFEARHHNANRIAMSATSVAALGLLYGIAVAAITLSIVSASFPVAGSPDRWDWGNNHDMLPIVAFRGAVAVLTGTLLQVLWSDRTVASPLDRMTWRKS